MQRVQLIWKSTKQEEIENRDLRGRLLSMERGRFYFADLSEITSLSCWISPVFSWVRTVSFNYKKKLKGVPLMGTRERILSLRLMMEKEKHPEFFEEIGVDANMKMIKSNEKKKKLKSEKERVL